MATKKSGGIRQWINRFFLFYVGGLIAFVLLFRYLRLSDEAIFGLRAAVVVFFPMLYLIMTGFILPLSRREFKNAGQRTLVTIGLAVATIAFFGMLPVLVPFLGFIFVVWFASNMPGRSPDLDIDPVPSGFTPEDWEAIKGKGR